MTPLEFAKLLDCIRFNNGWGERMYENQVIRHRRYFKYIKSEFDTRDGHIWRIELREYGGSIAHAFNINSKSDIDRIYDFLNETIEI